MNLDDLKYMNIPRMTRIEIEVQNRVTATPGQPLPPIRVTYIGYFAGIEGDGHSARVFYYPSSYDPQRRDTTTPSVDVDAILSLSLLASIKKI